MYNKKQKLVFDELKLHKKPSEIHKEHKIPYPYISKVKTKILSGELPEGETVAPDLEAGPVNEDEETKETVEKKVKETQKQEIKQAVTNPSNKQQSNPQSGYVDISTLAKLAPKVDYITITPTMQNARLFLIHKLGWAQNVKWERIIDAVFQKYFKGTYHVLLSGWIELDGEEVSPSGAGRNQHGNNGNNGNNGLKEIDVNSPAFQELATMVTKQILQISQAAKQQMAEQENQLEETQ